MGCGLLVACALAGCGAGAPPDPAAAILRDLGAGIGPALEASRALLLGRRVPDGSSCVAFVPAGSLRDRTQAPPRLKIEGGGCATFMVLPRGGDPMTEHLRLQQEFRPWLERRRARCAEVAALLAEVAADAAQLAAAARSWAAVPAGLSAPAVAAPASSRPAHCLDRLGAAVRAGDLDGARAWSTELAAACDHLQDLLRWLDFLDGNLVTALSFQSRCTPVFQRPVDPRTMVGQGAELARYPAGSLLFYGERNHYEVERQAEVVFGFSREHPVTHEQPVEAAAADLRAGAACLPPYVRAAFLTLRRSLTGDNQLAWDRAAGAPFDRSCLENMLFRIGAAGAVGAAGEALANLDRRTRRATSAELLDVVFYRGGGFFCGLEWGDRFDARLTRAAAGMRGDARLLLQQAREFAFAKYDADAYRGGTFTLRSALETRSFDCIRSTDMIGAVYRNAGGANFVELRECKGGPSHTVAGVRLGPADGGRVVAVDGLRPPRDGVVTWPDGYFASPDAFCVEVYGRGLDTSVWLAGYVVRGPHAGTRVDAAVPYLEQWRGAGVAKIYGGPYPDRRGGG